LYPAFVNSAFYFIPRLRKRASANGTQRMFAKRKKYIALTMCCRKVGVVPPKNGVPKTYTFVRFLRRLRDLMAALWQIPKTRLWLPLCRLLLQVSLRLHVKVCNKCDGFHVCNVLEKTVYIYFSFFVTKILSAETINTDLLSPRRSAQSGCRRKLLTAMKHRRQQGVIRVTI